MAFEIDTNGNLIATTTMQFDEDYAQVTTLFEQAIAGTFDLEIIR